MCSPLFLPKPIFVYTNALHFQKTIEGLYKAIPARHWWWKQTLMYRHSGFSLYFNLQQWSVMLPSTTKHTWNDLCAKCTESSHTKQRQLNFTPWVCSEIIPNNSCWAYPVFLSHTISLVSKGSWWDLALMLLCLSYSVLPWKHTASRASSLLLGVWGLEEDNLQNFKHQQEAEAPCCPLNSKCQKKFKWYFITACTPGWWKAVSWKQVGWPVCYFCRGKNFSTQQCITQQFCVIGGCSTIMAQRGGDDMQNNCIYDFRLSASAIPRDKQRPHLLAANCVRASRGHSLHLTPLPQRKKHSWVSMDLN